MWTQIVGKIRLARMPWLNHTWQVTLYPTACGLTTGRMPYGDEAFEIDFDFIAHELNIRTSRGDHGLIQLVPGVRACYLAPGGGMDGGCLLVGLVVWALGVLFVFILMRAASDQDRNARHSQKDIDPYTDVTITRPGE